MANQTPRIDRIANTAKKRRDRGDLVFTISIPLGDARRGTMETGYIVEHHVSAVIQTLEQAGWTLVHITSHAYAEHATGTIAALLVFRATS
ncbi:hypothetical protein ACH47Z_44020 [Streptomyces sp. NPDC020192]|uniref:hypothetical protein n=1 Tax=Streptomyces sp. NPDC020192 TaxID=3365066 RepID=UPI0037981DA7